MPRTAPPIDVVVVPSDLPALGPGRSVRFQLIGAVTTAPFYLIGGRYGIVYRAGTWGGGNVVLNVLAADDITFVPAATAATGDSTALVDIPSGHYNFVVTTSTAVSLAMTRIQVS
jgi:hypothetical protein